MDGNFCRESSFELHQIGEVLSVALYEVDCCNQACSHNNNQRQEEFCIEESLTVTILKEAAARGKVRSEEDAAFGQLAEEPTLVHREDPAEFSPLSVFRAPA